MWGIIPSAGAGSRIQPLAFSKELLPVGSRFEDQVERPRAVSEYLIDRMIAGGADKLCFVISPGKSDILQYFGGSAGAADIAYVVQPRPAGLCDAIFRALPFIDRSETVLVGLPDTIWLPENGLDLLEDDTFSFLLFPVEHPRYFDAVVTDDQGKVLEIQVKSDTPSSNWIWGAFKLPAQTLYALYELWCERGRGDEYIGTLVNAYLLRGGLARGVRAGQAYVDVGTLHGYREAIHLLSTGQIPAAAPSHPADRTERNSRQVIAEPKTDIDTHSGYSAGQIKKRIHDLGIWFHNMDLNGVPTAPDHFLGDYPNIKWRRFAHALPPDLTGKTVLDIGCNAGFYSIEMKRRGAERVLGIDFDETYLDQARFAAEVNDVDIEFRQLSVYDVADLNERFDLVLFMGVWYHLKHPLLALERIYEHTVRDLFVFQSMLRGSTEVEPFEKDYPFSETEIFERETFPRMYFIEHNYSGDPTNWWIPNRACVEAMLRTTGFDILAHPEEEVYICRRRQRIENAPFTFALSERNGHG